MQKEMHRSISRGLVGGSKFIHALPRPDRALVLASLMQEAPAKRQSEVRCAFYAFKDSVEKDDPFRAHKIFERHGLGASGKAEEIRTLISAKIDALNAEGKNGRADSFAILFLKDEAAISRFSARMEENIRLAKDKMQRGDYPFTYVLLNEVLEAESKLCLSIHTHEAALLLATHHLRGKNFEKAMESIGKALECGPLSSDERSLMSKEIGDFMSSVSEGHLNEVAEMARKDMAVLSLCNEAVSARISESYNHPDDTGKLEGNFNLAYSFQMHEEVAKYGRFLSSMLLGKANADPEKFYKEYLRAARIANMAGARETMDESIFKFITLCEKLGKNDPSIYAEGFAAAQEFSLWDQANSLGDKAFFGFVSRGDYANAKQIVYERPFERSSVWEIEKLIRRLEQVKKRLV